MNMPLELCESRDAKGLYKLARAGKIKGVFRNITPIISPLACSDCWSMQRKEIKLIKADIEAQYMICIMK